MIEGDWARRTLDEKAIKHYWTKPYEGGCEFWYSHCGMTVRVPSWIGPWSDESGMLCDTCQEAQKKRLEESW